MNFLKRLRLNEIIVIAAMIVGLAGLIRFVSWSAAHDAMDYIIVAGFVMAIVFDVLLLHFDNDIFYVLATTGYSLALFKLLSDSVGTFVDLFQGINMFGDVSQMGNIVSISILAAISSALSVIVSFMTRRMK